MKNNILFLTRSLEIGGLEKVIVLLANNLDRERFTPHICCIADAGIMAKALRGDVRLFVIGNSGRMNLYSFRYIHRLIKEHSIALVHAHEFAALMYGLPVAKLFRVPIVYTKHGYKPQQERKAIELIGRWFSKSVDEYICVSEELRNRMKPMLRLKDEKISIIYNGIESFPETESASDERRSEILIGSVGRLNEAKNYGLLISAFSGINTRYPNCRLEIVGGGECEDELRAMINEMSISNKVQLHGFQTDVSRFLDRFDIFALTSIREGHSISLLEAMSKRKICVVSNVGGNAEIIKDGANGFIFESQNEEDLINTLSKAIDGLHSKEFNIIRENAWNTIQNRFSVKTMIQRHEELYEKHINRDS